MSVDSSDLHENETIALKRGAFCISIDLELAWGVWDIVTPDHLKNAIQLESNIVERLMALFQKYDVSATWAIVGALLEKQSSIDPNEISAWYAPDIVNSIRISTTAQEIGSHSFAHIYYSENSSEEARFDIESAAKIHSNYQLEFSSFVFPRNMVKHIGLLANAGIKVFRSVDQGWYIQAAQKSRIFGRIANLIDKMLPITPSVSLPILHKQHHLIELPSSMLLMGRNGLRRFVHPAIITLKAKRGLQAAIRRKSIFHLWFHPSNFYHDTEKQFRILESLLQEASRLRKDGLLEIRTMGSFAHV